MESVNCSASCSNNRFNANGFGGYVPQGQGNFAPNQYPGQFGQGNRPIGVPPNGAFPPNYNQIGNGAYPPYGGQGNFGSGNFGPGNFGPGNFGPGNIGQGNLGQGNFGQGNFGQGNPGQGNFGPGQYYPPGIGAGGKVSFATFYTDNIFSNFFLVGPNRFGYNPYGNNAANGILVGPGGPTGQYGRYGLDQGPYNRPPFGANGPYPGGPGGPGFGNRPFGYGSPYNEIIPFNSKSGSGILADETTNADSKSKKDNLKRKSN